MRKLANHIRAHRKRLGFKQADLALLMNRKWSNVCRNERRHSEPALRTAIRFAIILQVSVEELFPGIVEVEQIQIRERVSAKLLERPDFDGSVEEKTSWSAFETLDSTLTGLTKDRV